MEESLAGYFRAELRGAQVVDYLGDRDIFTKKPHNGIDFKISGTDEIKVARAAEQYFKRHGYSVLSRLDASAFGMEKDGKFLSIVATPSGRNVLFSAVAA